MLMNTVIVCLLLLTSLFVLSNHPLMLGFMLMMVSVLYGLLVHLMMKTPWMAYLLIMVFLSGMMIMFMYMASLSSNELMVFDLSKLMSVLLVLLFMVSNTNTDSWLHETLINKNSFNKETMNLIFKTYNEMLSELTMIIILYLLVVLISAMKIIIMNKGPLRSKK